MPGSKMFRRGQAPALQYCDVLRFINEHPQWYWQEALLFVDRSNDKIIGGIKMLIKMIKHDFRYSAKTFFVLGTIAIVILAILVTANYMHQVQRVIYMLQSEILFVILLAIHFSTILLAAVVIITLIQIGYFYRKSMFGRAGHLTMTIPVSRGTLLASKLAVSFVWLMLYAIIVALFLSVVVIILIPMANPFFGSGYHFHMFRADILVTMTHTFVTAFAAIALLFFCITLSHSVLANVRLHGIISGAIGLLCAWLYSMAANALTVRFLSDTSQFFHGPAAGLIIVDNPPLVGLQYGRIVIGQNTVGQPAYIDIFLVAFTLAAAAIAIAATHYLLKKRISLQ